MDATNKQQNLVRSIKKLLVDNLEPLGIEVSFDRVLTQPDLQSSKTTQWVSVIFGETFTGIPVVRSILYIHCLTRQDADNARLVAVVDSVRNLFEDGYVPIYDTEKTPWTIITNALPSVSLSTVNDLADQTKHREITVELTYGVC